MGRADWQQAADECQGKDAYNSFARSGEANDRAHEGDDGSKRPCKAEGGSMSELSPPGEPYDYQRDRPGAGDFEATPAPSPEIIIGGPPVRERVRSTETEPVGARVPITRGVGYVALSTTQGMEPVRSPERAHPSEPREVEEGEVLEDGPRPPRYGEMVCYEDKTVVIGEHQRDVSAAAVNVVGAHAQEMLREGQSGVILLLRLAPRPPLEVSERNGVTIIQKGVTEEGGIFSLLTPEQTVTALATSADAADPSRRAGDKYHEILSRCNAELTRSRQEHSQANPDAGKPAPVVPLHLRDALRILDSQPFDETGTSLTRNDRKALGDAIFTDSAPTLKPHVPDLRMFLDRVVPDPTPVEPNAPQGALQEQPTDPTSPHVTIKVMTVPGTAYGNNLGLHAVTAVNAALPYVVGQAREGWPDVVVVDGAPLAGAAGVGQLAAECNNNRTKLVLTAAGHIEPGFVPLLEGDAHIVTPSTPTYIQIASRAIGVGKHTEQVATGSSVTRGYNTGTSGGESESQNWGRGAGPTPNSAGRTDNTGYSDGISHSVSESTVTGARPRFGPDEGPQIGPNEVGVFTKYGSVKCDLTTGQVLPGVFPERNRPTLQVPAAILAKMSDLEVEAGRNQRPAIQAQAEVTPALAAGPSGGTKASPTPPEGFVPGLDIGTPQQQRTDIMMGWNVYSGGEKPRGPGFVRYVVARHFGPYHRARNPQATGFRAEELALWLEHIGFGRGDIRSAIQYLMDAKAENRRSQ